MCECNCDCEIDTSRLEEYEVKDRGQWRQVVSLSDTGYGELNNPVRFSVVFKTPETTNGHGQKWAPADLIRRKPKWQPEVGKWYFFSDIESKVGTTDAAFSRLTEIKTNGEYAAMTCSWKYCWPAGDLIELGE